MMSGPRRRAVAIGGGTGLPAVITSLLSLGFETTAVVTMADDGGSSGHLRRELGTLPPGDVRNCLVAMAAEPDGLFARLLQYRFPNGEGLAGHALGNLILAALTDIADDFPTAISTLGGFLDARGTVLPSTLENVQLHGVDRSGREVFGQASLACNPAPVARVYLEPSDPVAYAPAIAALEAADAIVIGPGSLYTSIIPNLLVAGICDAISASKARRVYVCNVANMRGETFGLDAADHFEALAEHGLPDGVDTVVVHRCTDGEGICGEEAEPVGAGPDVLARIAARGPEVVVADLADGADPYRHSQVALERVLMEVLG